MKILTVCTLFLLAVSSSPLHNVFLALVQSTLPEKHLSTFKATIDILQDTYSRFLSHLSRGNTGDTEKRLILDRLTVMMSVTKTPFTGELSPVDVMGELLDYKTIQYTIIPAYLISGESKVSEEGDLFNKVLDELTREVAMIDPYVEALNGSEYKYQQLQYTVLFNLIERITLNMYVKDERYEKMLLCVSSLGGVLMSRLNESGAHDMRQNNCTIKTDTFTEPIVSAPHTVNRWTLKELEMVSKDVTLAINITSIGNRRKQENSDLPPVKYMEMSQPMRWYMSSWSSGVPQITTQAISILCGKGKSRMTGAARFAVLLALERCDCQLHDLLMTVALFVTKTIPDDAFEYVKGTYLRRLFRKRLQIYDTLNKKSVLAQSTIYGRLVLNSLTGSIYYRERIHNHHIDQRCFRLLDQRTTSDIGTHLIVVSNLV